MNSTLVSQSIQWAQEAKARSTSTYVDTRQDQIIAAAQQIKPEGGFVLPLTVELELPFTVPVTVLDALGGVREMGLLFARPSKRGAGAPTTPPNMLTITTQPSSGPVNDVAFSTQPVIQLRDTNGNPLPTAGITVTIGLASGAGILGGTLSVNTDASGVATFTNLKITGLVGVRTLQFTAFSYTTIVSSNVTVAVGAANKASITTQPGSAADGVAFTVQPVIQIQDISGNNVSSTVNVVATKATGPGTLSGTTTVACVGGVATFTNLALTGTGGYTLTFTPTALTATTSASFTVGASSPIYPNRPANYTTVITDYDFPTAIPTGGGGTIPDGSGWVAVNSNNTLVKASDAGDPISPSSVLQWTYVSGQGTPTNGTAFGHLFKTMPSGLSFYVAFSLFHDANFEWNAVSNKLFEFLGQRVGGGAADFMIQTRVFGTYWTCTSQNALGDDVSYNLAPNVAAGANPTGQWVKVEMLVTLGASGSLKIWVNEVLVSDYPSQVFFTPAGAEFSLNSTWGGGSGPTTRDSTRKMGHIFIAQP